MAAPITAYLDNKNDLQNGANNYDTYIARFLQNTTPTSGDDWGDGYFNSTDDDATKKSKICDIFKLDGFLTQQEGLSIGFIGFAQEGEENAAYHKNTRSSYKRLYKDGVTYIIFNDAGLNRLAECSTGSNILKYANMVLNNVYFRSSYHNNSTAFGIKYRINSGSWVTASNQDLNGVVQSSLNKKEKYTLPLVAYPPSNEGDFFEVKAYITNDEGITEGTVVGFLLDDRIENVDATYRTDPQSSTGETNVDFWMLAGQYAALSTLTDTAQSTGLYGHTTPYRNIPITSGWYVGILADKAIYADTNGQFTHYVALAPATWILSCSVDTIQETPESPLTHQGIYFELNFNAPSNILITGYVSETPAGQPQVGGFSFSSTLLQGSSSITNLQSVGFEYTGTEYYLIVTTPNHPHIQITGDGQFI